jgi:hypothetical protein
VLVIVRGEGKEDFEECLRDPSERRMERKVIERVGSKRHHEGIITLFIL